jgi:hypothetical protein
VWCLLILLLNSCTRAHTIAQACVHPCPPAQALAHTRVRACGPLPLGRHGGGVGEVRGPPLVHHHLCSAAGCLGDQVMDSWWLAGRRAGRRGEGSRSRSRRTWCGRWKLASNCAQIGGGRGKEEGDNECMYMSVDDCGGIMYVHAWLRECAVCVAHMLCVCVCASAPICGTHSHTHTRDVHSPTRTHTYAHTSALGQTGGRSPSSDERASNARTHVCTPTNSMAEW